jgi:transposase
MTEFRELIRRFRAGLGIRQIQRDTGIHRTIIRGFRALADLEGWLDPDTPLPSEEEIQRIRSGAGEKRRTEHPLCAFREEFRRWVKEEYSFVVMHQLIKDRYACSEATIRRFVGKYFPSGPKPVMVRPTIPGQDMEVDFGYLGITYDPQSRRNRKTYVFSARLRHSRLAYRETVFTQKARTFLMCHMHAFEYFGGVACKVIPDNLKAAVIGASHQDPVINRVYHELAEHYGFLISPCPPREPKKKGGVENDIKYVKGNFWPLFKEKQRALGRAVPRNDELALELERWTREVSETRLIRGVGRSPREIFESEEKQALQGLPAERWDALSWATPRVGVDFLVQFEKAFYSVAYEHIGERVVVLGGMHTVRIFVATQEIARHQRAARPWQILRNPLHAPPELEQYMNTTAAGLIEWSYRIGGAVGEVAERIMSDKAVDGMRPVRSLIQLSRKYSPQRLVKACQRALLYDTAGYRSVKMILEKNLDSLPLQEATQPSGQKLFRFQRQARDFDPLSLPHSQN